MLKITKTQISNLLRRTGLLFAFDGLMFRYKQFENRKVNQTFKQLNPRVKLPPDYLIYESFQINYQKYYTESLETTKWIVGLLEKHIELRNSKILDWGCGPGRLVRHLPSVLGNQCEYHGTDYNEKSIEWCKQNLKGISFNLNRLQAHLPYPDRFFDAIYGLSIFTHLSEQLHFDWCKELCRVLKPNGILLVTTQGDNYKVKLTSSELKDYIQGQVIVRGQVKEGHRTYSAFHPDAFMHRLFANLRILEHLKPEPEAGKWLPQDIWLVSPIS